jgi:sulfate adenylyltransferase subunit 2
MTHTIALDAELKVQPERLNHLEALEAESIAILREAVAEFARPVMLYSIGKDSSVMLRLAQKAFYPGKIPFPLLHVDTSYKFPEMIAFRDAYAKEIGAELIVHRNEEAIAAGANPYTLGTQNCCGLLKTRDSAGQWDPKSQRPELWSLYNSRLRKGESIRVFPLSNWTELDIWLYLHAEKIPIVPLYFAKERPLIIRGGQMTLVHDGMKLLPREEVRTEKVRMRSLGCLPCTGAMRSDADTLPKIIEELLTFRRSERENRAIDHDEEGSMEVKKREGYF